ncbi:protein of unknown function [Taphrina deformans PYCC 5710]|uniref:Uncharacterized protein n=1 Tax=Taphrina deformans (strain PYCC 5710 / ATCC 11124 / CBS 356.35 / IMI 108563 / JCM 9778 / NBRC 8474) TaxID=1097556 RepID=R4XB92_TAPDE|nr:protein of unknown function [Taphrina deformans PYCC 5710]|eukprot:CCG81612.1 protein of unknown function [Taphrina deformans PYCC 5710]
MSDLGKHEQQFTGRGGAGNFVIRNPIPAENLPKAYSQKPIAGNFSGRGGAGNYKNSEKVNDLPASPVAPASSSPKPPAVYKGGRGGAGNIEAVQSNEKSREDRELDELIRIHTELREGNALPQAPVERPILRID